MNEVPTTEHVAVVTSHFPTSALVALIFSLAGAFFIGLYILRRIRNKSK